MICQVARKQMQGTVRMYEFRLLNGTLQTAVLYSFHNSCGSATLFRQGQLKPDVIGRKQDPAHLSRLSRKRLHLVFCTFLLSYSRK